MYAKCRTAILEYHFSSCIILTALQILLLNKAITNSAILISNRKFHMCNSSDICLRNSKECTHLGVDLKKQCWYNF